MLPFSIIPLDAPSKEAQKAIAEDQDRARQCDMSGENTQGAMSPSDAKKLYNSKGYIPREWPEAEVQLELCAVMLGTILGCQHRVVKAYLAAYNRYKNIRIKLHAAMDLEFNARLAPALLVFYFQLLVRGWFEERWRFEDDNNPPPDFMFGLREFTQGLRLSWLPGFRTIPALAALAPANDVPGPRARTAGAGVGAGGGSLPPPIATADRVQNPN